MKRLWCVILFLGGVSLWAQSAPALDPQLGRIVVYFTGFTGIGGDYEVHIDNLPHLTFSGMGGQAVFDVSPGAHLVQVDGSKVFGMEVTLPFTSVFGELGVDVEQGKTVYVSVFEDSFDIQGVKLDVDPVMLTLVRNKQGASDTKLKKVSYLNLVQAGGAK